MSYRQFSDYARERFGSKVYKVPIDAGFDCPNRDGTKGVGGCTFCRAETFRPDYTSVENSFVDQFLTGRELFREKNAEFFLPYFQTNTNTYAPVERLETYYRSVLRFDDVVGLCIGTRPDCVGSDVIELLEALSSEDNEIWLELGLQSSHNQTLERVNRCHGFEQYEDVVREIRQSSNIKVCTHVIFGLPGESPGQMKQTIRDVTACGLDGIKFHQLQIVDGTPMAEDYRQGEVDVLSYETYRDLVDWSLNFIPDDVVVHRIMADTTGEHLLAPTWDSGKHQLRRWLTQNVN